MNVSASCCSIKRLESNSSPLYFLLGVRVVHAGKAMTPSDSSIAIILFLLYCLAAHLIHLERRKQRYWASTRCAIEKGRLLVSRSLTRPPSKECGRCLLTKFALAQFTGRLGFWRLRYERHLAFNIFDAVSPHTVAGRYTRPIHTSHKTFPLTCSYTAMPHGVGEPVRPRYHTPALRRLVQVAVDGTLVRSDRPIPPKSLTQFARAICDPHGKVNFGGTQVRM